MRGVHRKREEPPRWTPTLTPIQQRLSRRLGLIVCAMVVTDIGGGVLYVMDARWFWPVTFSMTASFAWYLLTVRALIQTGPPINPVRWWWPWGSPRA